MMAEPIQRRQLLVGGGALLVAGAAYAAEPRRNVADFSKSSIESLVPMRAGAWSGAIDPDVVPETVDASIDHGQTLTRRYQGAQSASVMLVVSYHGPQSPDLKVHRPETCYAVAGFQGGAPRPIVAPMLVGGPVPAVTFTARRDDRIETVLYWTRVGDRFPQNLTTQRVDFLLEALRGVRADGLLFRASVVGSDPASSLQMLKVFSASLVEAAPARGRVLLLGPEAARAA